MARSNTVLGKVLAFEIIGLIAGWLAMFGVLGFLLRPDYMDGTLYFFWYFVGPFVGANAGIIFALRDTSHPSTSETNSI